jgi:hypothetical protein
MFHQHRVFSVHELLAQILFFLTSPRDLIHAALVCRSFMGAALHILWRAHQFSFGPLLHCAPKPLLGPYCGNLANVSLVTTFESRFAELLAPSPKARLWGSTTIRAQNLPLDAVPAIC